MTDVNNGGPAPAPPVPPAPQTPPAAPPRWEPSPAPAAPPVPPESYRRRSGVGFGIALIVIGFIVLMSWFVPGLAWWTLWPIIIMVAGVVQMFTPSRREWVAHNFFDGFGTVLFGGVLLGCTTGYVAWSMWWILLTLWPVLLIAGGIAIIGKAMSQTWLRALAPVVIWLAVLYAASVSLTGQGGLQPVFSAPNVYWSNLGFQSSAEKPFSYSEPVGETTDATLNLAAGAGDIRIGSGTDLVRASGTTAFSSPTFTVKHSGTSATVDIGMGDQNGVVVFPGSPAGQMDVKLSNSVLWDATISTGASSVNADLSDVKVKSLTLKTGVADTTMKLGAVPSEASRAAVVIKAGVSSVTVLVPKGAPVRVETHSGLTTTNFAPDLTNQGGGVWQTAGFSSTDKAWDISVESGVSTVSIRTY